MSTTQVSRLPREKGASTTARTTRAAWASMALRVMLVLSVVATATLASAGMYAGSAPASATATSATAADLRPLATLELYVAPDGDDAASGSIDAPLASLKGARDKLRTLKQQGPLPQGGATVYLRGGTYLQEQGLRFGP